MRSKWIWIAPLAVVGFVAFVAAGGWVVQYLWNWLVPSILGLRTITFWEALGMVALTRILFGGFGGGGHGPGPGRRRHRHERCGPQSSTAAG
jgi:hypothetical protein